MDSNVFFIYKCPSKAIFKVDTSSVLVNKHEGTVKKNFLCRIDDDVSDANTKVCGMVTHLFQLFIFILGEWGEVGTGLRDYWRHDEKTNTANPLQILSARSMTL